MPGRRNCGPKDNNCGPRNDDQRKPYSVSLPHRSRSTAQSSPEIPKPSTVLSKGLRRWVSLVYRRRCAPVTAVVEVRRPAVLGNSGANRSSVDFNCVPPMARIQTADLLRNDNRIRAEIALVEHSASIVAAARRSTISNGTTGCYRRSINAPWQRYSAESVRAQALRRCRDS
jgi:hypothetical protein